MAKTLDAKCKQCRREGEKLFLKGERCYSPKCAMVKKNYPPGIHGSKGRPRLTSYGFQLREKQKAKKIYGLLEKQFKNYYLKAAKKAGDIGQNMLEFLEMRLDNIIYQAGFATSRRLARQLVNHGHFLINKKRVSIPSYQLKVNDEITLKEKSLKNKYWQELLKTIEKREIPSWLKVDKKNLTIKILSVPTEEMLKQSIAMNLIIEYYSR